MAVLYTEQDTQCVLAELRIRPINNNVTSAEAARILSWRAKKEHGIDHEYTLSAVRRHVALGHLAPIRQSTRFNRYRVEDIFALPLSPRRGLDRSAA